VQLVSLFKHKKTVYLLDGKQVPAGTEGAKKQVVASKKWYARVRFEDGRQKNVPLSTDKKAAQVMLAELLRKIERRKSGIETAEDDYAMLTVESMIDDFEKHLRAKGNSERHIDTVIPRLKTIKKGCKWTTLGEISAKSFLSWLEMMTAEEKLSQQTVNHYRAHAKGFTSWLTKKRMLKFDPLTSVPGQTKVSKPTYVRRALSEDEVEALLKATRESKQKVRKLEPVARHSLYALALGSGLRVGALASLRPVDFDMESKSPSVTVSPDADKSKKGRTQPLPTSLVPILKEFFAERKPEKLCWPGSWSLHAAKMIRVDALAAKLDVGTKGDEDADENVAIDFHSLRHTYGTNLGRNGVNLRVAQELMGHSTPTLTARYSHPTLHDLAGAVENLNPRPSGEELVVTPVVKELYNSTQPGAVPCNQDGGTGVEAENRGVSGIAGVCSDMQSNAGGTNERPRPDSNRGITVLQTAALPLGYEA
jgi:integrase